MNGVVFDSKVFDRGMSLITFDRGEVVATMDTVSLVAQPAHGAFTVDIGQTPSGGRLLGDLAILLHAGLCHPVARSRSWFRVAG